MEEKCYLIVSSGRPLINKDLDPVCYVEVFAGVWILRTTIQNPTEVLARMPGVNDADGVIITEIERALSWHLPNERATPNPKLEQAMRRCLDFNES